MPLENGDRAKLNELERRLERTEKRLDEGKLEVLNTKLDFMRDLIASLEADQDSLRKTIRAAAFSITGSAILFALTTFALLGRI